MKQIIKKLFPPSILTLFLPVFHVLQSLFWNAVNGFPARGMNVVGITGTNGKTTTAAFLGKIFERNGWKVGINSTAFYQIGAKVIMNDTNMTVVDPARFYKIMRDMRRAGVDWVILETTSHALKQHRTLGVPYRVAAITNLTQDHLDYHGTMDNYAAAKAKLFKKQAKLHVFNLDDEWYQYFSQFSSNEHTLTYGVGNDADCRILKAQLGPTKSKLELKLERVHIAPTIHLVGKFNAYNALCAATIAHGLGIAPEAIESGIESLEHVPGRMEMIKTKRGYSLVIDYAHTPDAIQNVLESLRAVTKKRIITVFGATGERDTSKRPIMGSIAARLSDVVIVTDDDPYTENPITIRAEVLHGVHEVKNGTQVYEIADRRSAIAKAIQLAATGDTILLAGIGHQKYRVIDGKKVDWSERGIVEELLS